MACQEVLRLADMSAWTGLTPSTTFAFNRATQVSASSRSFVHKPDQIDVWARDQMGRLFSCAKALKFPACSADISEAPSRARLRDSIASAGRPI